MYTNVILHQGDRAAVCATINQVLNTLLYRVTNLINHELKANKMQDAICVKVKLKLSRSFIPSYLSVYLFVIYLKYAFQL